MKDETRPVNRRRKESEKYSETVREKDKDTHVKTKREMPRVNLPYDRLPKPENHSKLGAVALITPP